MKTPLPLTVPALLPRQFCREWSDGHGRQCLLAWVTRIFGEGTPGERRADRALIREAERRVGGRCIVDFNDDPGTPRAALAEVWRAAMRRMGYRRRGAAFVRRAGRKAVAP